MLDRQLHDLVQRCEDLGLGPERQDGRHTLLDEHAHEVRRECAGELGRRARHHQAGQDVGRRDSVGRHEPGARWHTFGPVHAVDDKHCDLCVRVMT